MKTFLKLVLTMAVITSIYLIYFFSIGIPKTQARTYYNKAMEDISLKHKQDLEKQDLQKALSYWPEQYIQEAYDKLNIQ